MRTADRKLLLASIHDVGPGCDREVDALAELLDRQLGGPNFATLVEPDHWGENPLLPARRLPGGCGSAEQGVEMFVHGWYHEDRARHAGLAVNQTVLHMLPKGKIGMHLGISDRCSGRHCCRPHAITQRPPSVSAWSFIYGDFGREADGPDLRFECLF